MIPAYVFDIDGTLADCSHRLHHIQREPGDARPKDWTAFFAACRDDAPIEHMCGLARTLMHASKVVLVSARSDECHGATRDWLDKHLGIKFRFAPLYMRRAGDHRDDNVIKAELLAELRSHGYEPIMVFEDRARVVKMWRDAGIPCAQVTEGDF